MSTRTQVFRKNLGSEFSSPLPHLERLQTRTSQKLADDGIGGDQARVNRQEPFEEGQQSLGFDEFGYAVGDLSQQRLGQRLERGQFIHQRGVEHHVTVFLVRENISLLAAAHRLPARDRLRGGVAALARVAHDAADQARVGGGDAVVAIQVDLRQGGDVGSKRAARQGSGNEARVESVDALEDQDLSLVESDDVPRFAQS